ncbi:MAG: 16S rRNA (uracil(1498)-N(3))-methyltransferase [Clostridia bacterium]|nr:16S rRNA (uracil(1498)-N(3))-methyltransferase [Clostridia bacterium]
MKFFVNENQILDNKIEIIGQDVNHIKNVLRKKDGDVLNIVCKDNNKNYVTEISEIDQEKIVTNIIDEKDGVSEANVSIHIFQGLPKADKMELIIQKCTEIGVSDITPVVFKRSVVKLDDKDKIKKLDRWKKIAEVAAKQSERDSILEVNPICNIDELCDGLEVFDCVILAYEKEEDRYLRDVINKIERRDNLKVAVIIGPEGGIDETEVEKLKKAKANSVSLGKRILRTETAPIVLASIIMYELGDIGGK